MTISIGLIGCGNISRSHLRGHLAVPDQAAATAVADVDLETAAERARQAGDVQVFASYERLSEDAPVDAVDICLPHHLHADAVGAAGVTLMCAHDQLTLPAVVHARDLIRRIRDGSRPVHTHEEGTDVLKVILAAYRSAQEKQEINL